MSQKVEKPVLSGQRIKTRKRDEKERYDPCGFRDAIISGLDKCANDFEAISRYLDGAGNKLDYRRYGECLFDILIAGGILVPGGTLSQEGDGPHQTDACIFNASDEINMEEMKNWEQVFIKLMRRYKYLEKLFQLPNDMDNYLKWKTMGGLKRMKKGVVPHKNLALVPEVEGREAKVPRYNLSEDISSASSTQVLSLDTEFSDDFKEMEQSKKEENADKVNYKDVATSAKPHYRSKYTQTVSRLVDTSSSPLKTITEEKSTSPMKHGLKPLKKGFMKPAMLMFSSDTPDVPSAASTSTVHFGPHSSSNDQCSLDAPHTSSNDPDSIDEEKAVELALKLTIRNINLNPKRYLGISKDSLWIIPEIKEHTGLDDVSIYLILKKIKTAHTFAELADDFGISESSATRIFRNGVPLLSPIMKELIVWPSNDSIKSELPKAFRARYGNVESIIDCLEIEISKPSDPVKQALTWSEYKKANTVKYLISSTPDGIINFISKGFGGRATDQTIVENSGYLDALKPGVVVMADRGFKNIDKLLYDKQCTLVRPPSVGSGDKLTKNEVLTTKRIASLRIHIERVIRRLREHKFLKPHACIHSKLISLTDHIMIIACGLTNLQEPLIK